MSNAAVAHELVIARPGTLPILITAPHGGTLAIPGVPERTRGIRSRDTGTLEIALALEKQLEQALGERPHLVAARFHRKYLDANRVARDAYESDAARPAYDAYHDSIRGYVREMKARFPEGAVLLDIHGQAQDPRVIHRGTRDGDTVFGLLRRHGEPALTGPLSLFGGMAARGLKVFPSGTPLGRPPEDPRWRGGHTVHAYGSGQGGLQAIQIEYGLDLRHDPQVVAATAAALVEFCRAYLGHCSAPASASYPSTRTPGRTT